LGRRLAVEEVARAVLPRFAAVFGREIIAP